VGEEEEEMVGKGGEESIGKEEEIRSEEEEREGKDYWKGRNINKYM